MVRRRDWASVEPRGCRGARLWILATTGALLALAGTRLSLAVQTSLGVGYDLRYSTNIDLAPVNEQRAWTHTPVIYGALRQSGARVEANVDFKLGYEYYRPAVVKDQWLGALNGMGKVHLIPDRLSWTIEDYYSQVPIDARSAESPSNRQNANVFWTGPDLLLRFGPAYTGQLQLRYGDVSYSDSDTNNSRLGWLATADYRASPTTRYSANLGQRFVAFDDDVANENFHRTDAFLGWSRAMARGDVSVAVGGTQINRERGDTLIGPLLDARFTKRLTPALALTLRTVNQYSDAGGDLLTAGEARSARKPDVRSGFADNPNPFYLNELALVLSAGRQARGSLDLTLYARKENYEATDLNLQRDNLDDNKRLGAKVNLRYPLGALTAVGAFASFERTDYSSSGREDTDTAIGIRWDYRLSRSLFLAFEAGRNQRSSDLPLDEYTEYFGLLSVGYTRSTLRGVID